MAKKVSKAKSVKAAYERVFETKDGQTVLIDLINSTGLMGSSLDLNRPDPITMAYNDGAKAVVHRIIHQIQLDPKKYLDLLKDVQGDEYELS